MKKLIPYGKQSITEDDIDAVINVLKSDYLTQGPNITEFEKAFSNYVGSKYAIAVSNGTAALHLCALALGVSQGQKVITSPITFAASANCIRYCGGEVVFCDIDRDSYLLDIKSVRRLLQSSPPGTYSGIIPVDFAGRAVNLEEFRKLADEFQLWIIEDACHSPGGDFIKINGDRSRCGSSEFADLAIFSFHPVKHIACGEGGMITTNDKELYEKLMLLRSHGITRDESLFINNKELAASTFGSITYPQWYMEMQILGYNYRLTDIQAALGISQLKRAELGLKKRLEIAKRYNEAFENEDFIKKYPVNLSGHALHLYIIEINNRLGLYNFLRKKGIFCQIHYLPVHLMPYYQNLGWGEGDFPNSEDYYSNCMSLPIYPSLEVHEQSYVIQSVKEFYD